MNFDVITSLAAPQQSVSVPTQEETTLTLTRNNRNSTFSIHVGAEAISKLEVEAAWTLVIGAFSLILISSPISVVLVTSLSCNHSYDDCTSVTWLIPYFGELVLTHTIFNPMVYTYRCHEFSDALKVMFGLCFCCQKTIINHDDAHI